MHTGDAAAARVLGGELGRLSAALFAEPNPAVIKAVLHAQGRIPTPAVRLPLLPAHPGSAPRRAGALTSSPAHWPREAGGVQLTGGTRRPFPLVSRGRFLISQETAMPC